GLPAEGAYMTAREGTTIPKIVERYGDELLPEWVRHQLGASTLRPDLLQSDQLETQSRQFLTALRKVLGNGGVNLDIDSPAWEETRALLADVSQARARQGFSPSETATFVFSLKQPLFERLRKELASDPAALTQDLWTATVLLDKLGLFTTEMYQKGREEVISRQQQEMLELST